MDESLNKFLNKQIRIREQLSSLNSLQFYHYFYDIFLILSINYNYYYCLANKFDFFAQFEQTFPNLTRFSKLSAVGDERNLTELI